MKESPDDFNRVREAAHYVRNLPSGKVLFEYLEKRLAYHKDMLLATDGADLHRRQGHANEVKQIIEELLKPPSPKKDK